MRIVVTGATGNVGTSVLQAFSADERVTALVGVARRVSRAQFERAELRAADVAEDDLRGVFAGADAVVHLAWQIQPSHDLGQLRRTNVEGSRRVFEAVVRAGVRTFVHMSSIGVYSPGPKTELCDESWPKDGVPTSSYSRHKAEVERILDGVERAHPDLRIVRIRPALIFKREAASGVRRLFGGPQIPRFAFDRRFLRVIPDHPRFRFQGVHSLDVGQAIRLATFADVRGPFNLASDQVLDSALLADAFHAKRVRVPRSALRALAAATWRMRLQRTDAGWLDLCFDSPLVSSARAREVLGWQPTRTSLECLLEFLDGARDGAGLDTPPLEPAVHEAAPS